MRYRLRTLLIALAVLPPILAMRWLKYSEWAAQRQRRAELAGQPGIRLMIPVIGPGVFEVQFTAPALAAGIPNQESDGQVFSFQMGFAR